MVVMDHRVGHAAMALAVRRAVMRRPVVDGVAGGVVRDMVTMMADGGGGVGGRERQGGGRGERQDGEFHGLISQVRPRIIRSGTPIG